jgi:uncharacterized membrane protein
MGGLILAVGLWQNAGQLAPVLILAFLGFCGFVVYRAFRWFFRATR